MTHQYYVKGITCGGCINNVKKGLESVPGVQGAIVQKNAPQATVTMDQHIDTAILQQAIKQFGNYEISERQ
jgi:copper chaperone